MKLRSAFTVVQVQMPGNDRVGMVWIRDDCLQKQTMSVTNDAEAVCAALHLQYPNHRIIYCDTEGKWDELVHNAGVFKSFLPARNLAPTGKKIPA